MLHCSDISYTSLKVTPSSCEVNFDPIVNEMLLTLDVTFHIETVIVHATTALTFRERNNTLVLSCQDLTLLEHRLHTGLAIHYLTTLTFEEELVIFSCNYDCIIAGYNCNFAYVTSCTSDSNLTGKIHSKTLDLISQISADFINSQKLIIRQVNSQLEHLSGDWPLCVTIL